MFKGIIKYNYKGFLLYINPLYLYINIKDVFYTNNYKLLKRTLLEDVIHLAFGTP